MIYTTREQAMQAMGIMPAAEMSMQEDTVLAVYEQATKIIQDSLPAEMPVPLPLQDNQINVDNHLIAINEYGLGPSDPRGDTSAFWNEKAIIWGIPEGDARGRTCANCVWYFNTKQITNAIQNGPAWDLKASNLPVEPKWADMESHPTAYCDLLEITCSPTRTCNVQAMGGPIDDVKSQALGIGLIQEES